MGKKIKYFLIISIWITQLTGCKANNIKSLSIYWEKTEREVIFIEKDIEKFTKLYEIEEEKIRLFCEEWVKNPPTVQKIEEITVPTEEEIKAYLNMTIGEIEKLTGNTFYNGTTMVFSFVGFYTVINLEDAPIHFLCMGYDVWKKPAYVSLNCEYAEEYLKTINMSQNMNFVSIMDLWGKAEIEETNRFDEYHYRIVYERNDLIYEFISDNKEGNDFRFYIRQEWTF